MSDRHRLDLTTEGGRKLIAEVRLSRGFATGATTVRIYRANAPRAHSIFRVALLREIRDGMERTGSGDNDPLSLGHGSIDRVLAWIDGIGEGADHDT